VHSFVQWAHILKNVKKQMTKRYNSNILFRGHSMLNGLIKDFVAFFEPSTWTDEDEIRKKKIFKTIIVDGKCWYCGVEDFKDMDHFMPTNGRLFNPPMFGLEHEGNIIPSCKTCNANKSNKHPLTWLKKGRITKGKEFQFPQERIDCFQLFFDAFKNKLIADQGTTDFLVKTAIPKCEASTQELANWEEWDSLK